MFKPRPCGCKGQRTCKICEENFGAWKLYEDSLSDEQKENSFFYCPLCEKIWPGWEADSWENHPNHIGEGLSFPGIKLYIDFITSEEETELVKKLDEITWDLSQSGRLKQNYGPKCNFKKRKAKIGSFSGYPEFTKFIQDRFQETELLKNFQTVEQCSLDYSLDRGSSIDPHIDDCWIWGERIPTLNLLSDSCLTLTKYEGENTRYNLRDFFNYPSVVDESGVAKPFEKLKKEYESIENEEIYPQNPKEVHTELEKKNLDENLHSFSFFNTESSKNSPIIRVPMPRRSLIVLYGKPRYDWLHAILRQDIKDRRVCITYRELSPPFLSFGKLSGIGREIWSKSKQFWIHPRPLQVNSELPIV